MPSVRVLKEILKTVSDDELQKLYKKHSIGEWEFFSYYPPDKDDKAYKAKTVFVIEPKSSGKRRSTD